MFATRLDQNHEREYGGNIEERRRIRMPITLRPEHEQLIAEALRSGAYQSPDEVIKRALELLH